MGPSGAPKERPYAGDELADRKWLGHVVVGAGLEAADLVRFLPAGREHEDRQDRVSLADGFANLVAVDVGQHQVENHAVDVLRSCKLDRFFTLCRVYDPIPFEPQAVGEPERESWIILDEQNSASVF